MMKKLWQKHKISFFVLAIGLPTLIFFDADKRWKLAGTWQCERYSNGATVEETYGFFGKFETIDPQSGISGLILAGDYAMSGKNLVITLTSARVGDVVKDISGGAPAQVQASIGKLTSSDLIYNARVNNGSLDSVACKPK